MGQTGTLPGTKWDLSLGQTEVVSGTNRPFSVECHSKSPLCPVCPWDGWGSSLGRLSLLSPPLVDVASRVVVILRTNDGRRVVGRMFMRLCLSKSLARQEVSDTRPEI